MSPETWVVPWALRTWALLFVLVLGVELYALWWQSRRGNGAQRATLTSYVRAYFGIGDRRLKRRGRPAVMAVFLVWLLGHFMQWWP